MNTTTILLTLCFWGAVLGILHTYLFYPVLMRCLAKLPSRDRARYRDSDAWPDVNVVMAMYNEAAVIGDTLRSIVESEYPGKLTVTIGSDNSTDGSHEIVGAIQRDHPGVRLEIFEGRNGKIRILNRLVEEIREEGESVLILCDANVTWTRELPRALARHFRDPRIGIVASTVLDANPSGNGIAEEEEAYVSHENLVKETEGKLWGRMMGAFGACYAMRSSLFEEVPSHFNVDDFFETMVCYEKGFDGIVDPEARCHEAVSEEIGEEFRRKRRIARGNFQNLRRFLPLFLRFDGGSFAFWSHKGLRWIGPFLLLAILLSGSLLAVSGNPVYLLMTGGMLLSFLLAGLDWGLSAGGIHLRGLRFLRYFYVMNAALLLGALSYCRGIRNSVWEPTKRVGSGGIVTEKLTTIR